MTENSVIKVLVCSLGKVLFDGESKSVSLPSIDGVFEVSPNHIPVCCQLGNGDVVIMDLKQSFESTDNSMCIFQNGKLTVFIA